MIKVHPCVCVCVWGGGGLGHGQRAMHHSPQQLLYLHPPHKTCCIISLPISFMLDLSITGVIALRISVLECNDCSFQWTVTEAIKLINFFHPTVSVPVVILEPLWQYHGDTHGLKTLSCISYGKYMNENKSHFHWGIIICQSVFKVICILAV